MTRTLLLAATLAAAAIGGAAPSQAHSSLGHHSFRFPHTGWMHVTTAPDCRWSRAGRWRCAR